MSFSIPENNTDNLPLPYGLLNKYNYMNYYSLKDIPNIAKSYNPPSYVNAAITDRIAKNCALNNFYIDPKDAANKNKVEEYINFLTLETMIRVYGHDPNDEDIDVSRWEKVHNIITQSYKNASNQNVLTKGELLAKMLNEIEMHNSVHNIKEDSSYAAVMEKQGEQQKYIDVYDEYEFQVFNEVGESLNKEEAERLKIEKIEERKREERARKLENKKQSNIIYKYNMERALAAARSGMPVDKNTPHAVKDYDGKYRPLFARVSGGSYKKKNLSKRRSH